MAGPSLCWLAAQVIRVNWSCSEQSTIRNPHPHWHPHLQHVVVVVAVIMFIAFRFPLDILAAISLL